MTTLRERLPHPVRWVRARPRVFDALVAFVVCLMGLVSHFTMHGKGIADPSALGVVLCLFASLPIIARRRFPVVTLIVVLIAQFWMEIINAVGPGWTGVMIAAYSLGVYRNGRMMWLVGCLSWLVVTAFIVLGVFADSVEWGALFSTGILYASAIALGDNIRRRRERAAELVERAERAEREQELLAHRQVQHERVRIARELHDVVAHSVSVMVIQAGAARRQLATNPEATEQVLRLIEETGREAMTEMRRMLGVLRNELPDAEFEPQPSLTMLPQLVAGDTGLPTTLSITGDLGSVPAGIELSAYRVVQEALTNVRRHAGRVDQVVVNVVCDADELVVEVIDDGRGLAAAAPVAAGFGFVPTAFGGAPATTGASTQLASADPAIRGFGLVGMRERVAAFDGELFAGPTPGGGWRVRASFPLAELGPSRS